MVNYIGIILAADVSCDRNDMALFRPMVAALAQAGPATGPVGVVLADAGYCSEANLAAPGTVRLIAVKKDRRTRADRATTSGPAPQGLSRRAAMEHARGPPRDATSTSNVPGRSNPVSATSSTTWVSPASPAGRRLPRRNLPPSGAEWDLSVAIGPQAQHASLVALTVRGRFLQLPLSV